MRVARREKSNVVADMTLLLAEDDAELARQVSAWLDKAGHTVQWIEDGLAALQEALARPYDVVILDVNLPKMNGFDIVERMRQQEEMVPVLFLTARDGVTDRVRGLSAGGDDYLTKPFAMAELTARLDALNRRYQRAPTGQRHLGEWVLDTRQRRLRKANGEGIDLQPRESALLEMLLDHAGKTLTKKYLLEKLWNIRFDPGTNIVDSMVCRLRRKIEGAIPGVRVQTVRGIGYALQNAS